MGEVMVRFTRVTVAAFACLFMCTQSIAANDELSASFDSDIEVLMDKAGIPAVSLAVIRDGRLVKTNTYGVVSTEKNKPLTKQYIFQAASLSKPVLAYITLRLVDRGHLSLDTPLHTILSSDRFANQDYAKALTARLILSHQPGLPNWGDTPLEFQAKPGAGFQYSGEGYVYLQQVLSHITGLTLEQLAQKEVFKPLGMTKSHFLVPEDSGSRIANPHDNAGRALSVGKPFSNAASSLHTEAGDYARFILAVMEGKGLSESSHKLMMKEQVKVPVRRTDDNTDVPLSETIGWALGWGTLKQPEKELAWHWGDNGTYRAFVTINMVSKDAFVYFANTSLGHTIADDIFALAGEDISEITHWLEMKSYDSPGFQAWRQGVAAEANGDYQDAVAFYKQSVKETDGKDEGLKRLVDWYDAYLELMLKPNFSVDKKYASSYVGQYGPRKVWLENGQLHYQRGEGRKYRLISAPDHHFLLEGLVGFSFQFKLEGDSIAQGITGHYSDGRTDFTARGDE
ncbi:class A beta-lactamase-related serine hydrolase [Alteromonadaceae bacterium M269]|nr:class A beta-lactamase-related serine hydrolase [Alteromonadaceae bacterium M269]